MTAVHTHDHTHEHDHEHGHEHDHPHDHAHPHEAENPHAGQGAVMLDIGGDIGALVVTMPETTIGEEVEIRPADGPVPAHLPHVAVVPRPMDGQMVPSLVFAEVVEGRYALCPKGSDDVVLTATVRGGEVTFADWPA